VSQAHLRAALRVARSVLSAAAAVAIVVLSAVGPAAAHGELLFQVGPERVAPGGVIEVRGDFGAGDSVEIVMISRADDARRSIATVVDFEEGHFQSYLTVPVDLPAGDYVVEAVSETITMRAQLTVAGVAIAAGGERPNQDEALVGTLPSGGTGSTVETPAAGIPTGAVVPATGPDAWPIPPVVIAALFLLGAVGLLAGLRLAGRLRSGAG
jgi:hypothetical protein